MYRYCILWYILLYCKMLLCKKIHQVATLQLSVQTKQKLQHRHTFIHASRHRCRRGNPFFRLLLPFGTWLNHENNNRHVQYEYSFVHGRGRDQNKTPALPEAAAAASVLAVATHNPRPYYIHSASPQSTPANKQSQVRRRWCPGEGRTRMICNIYIYTCIARGCQEQGLSDDRRGRGMERCRGPHAPKRDLHEMNENVSKVYGHRQQYSSYYMNRATSTTACSAMPTAPVSGI